MTAPGGGSIAEAAVEVSADTRRFEPELERKLRTAGARAGRAFDQSMREQAEQTGSRVTRDVNGRMRDERGRFVKSGDEAGRTWGNAFRAALGLYLGGRALGALFGGATRFMAVSVVGSAATASAAGLVQLAAALSQVAGAALLVPSAATVAAAALGTMRVATIGVADAFDAALTGDAEEYAEALEGLSPAARSVTQELRDLRPELEQIQRQVQEAFFAQLRGDLSDVADVLAGPMSTGMTRVARSSGRLVSGLADVAQEAESVALVHGAFATTEDTVDDLRPAVQALARGFRDLALAALPTVENLGDSLADSVEKFGAWLSSIAESGQAVAWIDQALVTLRQFGTVAQEAGGIVAAVFRAADESGNALLETLGGLLGRVHEFLDSTRGQTALREFFDGAAEVGDALGPILEELVVQLGRVAPVAADVAQALGPGVRAAIEMIGDAIVAAGPIMVSLAGLLSDLAQAAAELDSPVLAAVAALTLFGGVLGRVVRWAGSAVGALRGLGRTAKDVGRDVDSTLDRASGDAEKKGRMFGEKLGRGLEKGVKAFPVVGAIAAVLDETITLTDSVTGQTAGIIEAATISIGRAWDALTGNGLPEAKVRGHAQTIAQAYGEEIAKLPPAVREQFLEIGRAWDEFSWAHEGDGVALAASLARGYLNGLQGVRSESASFWSGLALDVRTGTVNANTALSGAMQTMRSVMTGGLSQLRVSNSNAWTDIAAMTRSKSLSASEAVRGAIGVARTVMSGGLADMVGDTRSSWNRMRSSTAAGGDRVEGAVRDVAGSLVDAFGGLPGDLAGVGADMMAGLRQGILDTALSVTGAVGTVVSNAIKAARAAARSHSPSLEMVDLGRDLGAGLVIGVQHSHTRVRSAAERLSHAAMAAFDTPAARARRVGLGVGQGFALGLADSAALVSRASARIATAATHGAAVAAAPTLGTPVGWSRYSSVSRQVSVHAPITVTSPSVDPRIVAAETASRVAYLVQA